jgi:hypothetical protein
MYITLYRYMQIWRYASVYKHMKKSLRGFAFIYKLMFMHTHELQEKNDQQRSKAKSDVEELLGEHMYNYIYTYIYVYIYM